MQTFKSWSKHSSLLYNQIYRWTRLSIGGLIVDGGNFDWEAAADRFPMLNKPDPSYHGAVWSEAAKPLGPIVIF